MTTKSTIKELAVSAIMKARKERGAMASRVYRAYYAEAGIDPEVYSIIVGEGGAQTKKAVQAAEAGLTVIRIYESDLI